MEALRQYYKYLDEHGYGLRNLVESITEERNNLRTGDFNVIQKSKYKKSVTSNSEVSAPDVDNDSHVAKLPEDNQSVMGHIFDPKKKGKGHADDTPGNRKKLNDVGADEKNYVGKDKHGNDWHLKTNEDGTQTWVESRNGIIWDGGVNEIPKSWNPNTGLKQPSRGW